MKTSVICGVTLSLVVYNVESLYDLIKDKYIADFNSMGADEVFESSIFALKKAFSESLPLLKDILSERIFDYISSIETS